MSRYLSAAGEAVAELTERAAEEGRLSRGRALFRKGSVSGLTVVAGSVMASVRGSQGDDYETTVSTTPAAPGVQREVADGLANGGSVDDLIDDGVDICPREIDLAFDCDCGDWDEPCKHVVALLLAFADRVDLDEVELLRWRGIDASATAVPVTSKPEREPRPRSTSRPAPSSASANGEPDAPSRGTPSASRRPAPAEPTEPEAAGPPPGDEVDRRAKLSELKSLLGDTAMRPSADAGPKAAPRPSVLDPALADFLGLDVELDPLDLSDLAPPAPLFASMELGPLADLGPELATALAIIVERSAPS